jgi:tetratricopeptide (TPR) repeat protein
VALHPAYPPFHNNWGNALRDQLKFEESIPKYRKAIDLDPKFALPYNNWGNSLRDLGKFDEAIVKFQTAVQISRRAR